MEGENEKTLAETVELLNATLTENESLKKEIESLKNVQADLNKTILNLSVRPEKEETKQIDTTKNDLWGDIDI